MSNLASQTITLDMPLAIEGRTVTELTMRVPKVRDMKAARAKGTDYDQEITLFSNLCGIPPSSVEDMAMSDYKKLSTVFASFLG